MGILKNKAKALLATLATVDVTWATVYCLTGQAGAATVVTMIIIIMGLIGTLYT